jgi:hypothetical protein
MKCETSPVTNHPKPAPTDLLADPLKIAISVSQAAAILGVARTTALHAYKATGELIAGVPVHRVGRRCVVSTAHLRAALGLPDPVRTN